MIRLVEKSPDDLARWLPANWELYRQDLIAAGVSVGEAQSNVEHHRSKLFVDGRPAPGQHILDVWNDEDKIGSLWLSQQEEGRSSEWFVYDIVVDDVFRGRGFGRLGMAAAEEFVRDRGGTKLGLSVFGFNTVARYLYESMDYKIVSVSMVKEWDDV